MKIKLVSLLLMTLIFYSKSQYINTIKTQQENKKRSEKRRQEERDGYIKTYTKKEIRRRLEDDEDDDVEATSLVYDRCDHGHTPDDISDCTKYSTEESTCCIFTYGQDTGCVLIGFKYLGSKSVGDMTVNCYNTFLETFKFLSIILALLIL